MERLTEKKYWEKGWSNIVLPARYLSDYSHKMIANKFLEIIKNNHISVEKIIELGGCPGRWSDFFNTHFSCQCDIIDYGENSCEITKKNYELLGIKGKIINEDIFDFNGVERKYDIVISDGLVEHFEQLGPIFTKHLDLLNFNGLLMIGVPNVKQSFFYNYFSKKNEKSYRGFRIVQKEELINEAKKNNLDIIFCDYLGIINLGVVNWSFVKNKFVNNLLAYFFQFFNSLLGLVEIKKETKIFSPYIYLICKKIN